MQYKILGTFNKLASIFDLIHLVFLFKPAELLTAHQIQSKHRNPVPRAGKSCKVSNLFLVFEEESL